MSEQTKETLYEAGLVLEGGGMRGLYTAGVLDLFIEKGIYFRDCYGVSAGATQCSSYLASRRAGLCRFLLII